MIDEKIIQSLLVMFEQSIGYEFRVKGSALVDICIGVDRVQKLVRGKKYGDFGVHLCELTGERYLTFESWLHSPDGQECMRMPLSGPKYLEHRLWWAFQAGAKSTEKPAPTPEEAIAQAVKVKDAFNKHFKDE
jgi:hypothetical protein